MNTYTVHFEKPIQYFSTGNPITWMWVSADSAEQAKTVVALRLGGTCPPCAVQFEWKQK